MRGYGLFTVYDRVAVLVDNVFDNYYIYGGVELILGAVFFAIQIYCDFSSYSTIAIGAAEVMGFSLMENFDAPYLASSIKEFWRRWHVSLSTWFRDYLYIPLGGNRCSRLRKYTNIMITFFASGLWHGASLTYVFWGGLHGLYQVVGDLTSPLQKRFENRMNIKSDCFSYRAGKVLGTFVLTDIAWIFFRSPGIHAALSYIKRIIVDFDPWVLSNGEIYNLGIDRVDMNVVLFAIIFLVISDFLKYKKGKTIVDFVLEQNFIFHFAFVGIVLLYVLIFGAYGPLFDAKAFIYFQF